MTSLLVLVGRVPDIREQVEHALESRSVVLVAPTREDALLWLRNLGESRGESSQTRVRRGNLEIDLTSHRASWRGEILPLTEHELQILAVLASVPGRAWSFGELLEQVWGVTFRGDSSVVRSAIKRLRKKLARTGGKLSVEAVRGVGFCLAACEDASMLPSGRAERAPKPGWQDEGD